VQFDGGLAAAEGGPREQREAQVIWNILLAGISDLE
jgi:hypothetical protein